MIKQIHYKTALCLKKIKGTLAIVFQIPVLKFLSGKVLKIQFKQHFEKILQS